MSQEWFIEKREVGIEWKLNGTDVFSSTYDGEEQIITAVPTGLMTGDNAVISLIDDIYINAGFYTASAQSINNSNYKLPVDVTKNWTISQRDITAVINNDEVVYKSAQVVIEDLELEFTNQVLADEILFTTNLSSVQAVNVGGYNLKVYLDSQPNYNLVNSGVDIAFDVIPFTITFESLEWSYYRLGRNINSNQYQSEVYVGDLDGWPPVVSYTRSGNFVYHHIFRASASNTPDILSFEYQYFGLCTCGHYHDEGSSETYEFDPTHQWLDLLDFGGSHAGTYWIILNVDGVIADNYVFDEMDDGYDDTTYFQQDGSDYDLIYPNSDPTVVALESLPAGNIYVLKYIVNQSPGGFDPVYGEMEIDKVFDAEYFREEPEVLGEIEPEDIMVFINSVQYTYAQYLNNTITKNVGQYLIQFGIVGEGASSNPCDNIGGGIDTLEWTLNIAAREVIVYNTATPDAWTKTFDATTDYLDFGVELRYDYVDPEDEENNVHTGIIDSLNTFVEGHFTSATKGIKDIIFTVTGQDSSNYFISITADPDPSEPDTVTGEIIRHAIIITTSEITKVYDKTVEFSTYIIQEGSIYPSAPVTVQAEFDSYNAGSRTITFDILGDPLIVESYTLELDGVEDVFEITNAYIYKKGIEITYSTNTKVYDRTTDVTFSYDTGDIIEGDTVSIYAAYDNANTGTNKTIIYSFGSGGDENNYKFGDDGTDLEPDKDTITYNDGIITARELTIVWTDDRAHNIYDGNEQSVFMDITNIVYGDTLTGISDIGVDSSSYDNGGIECYDTQYTYSQTNAGNYSKTIDISADTNYVLSGDSSYNWSIQRRNITVNWDTDELGDWESFQTVYNNQSRYITYIITAVSGVTESGVVLGDDLGITVSALSATNAGDYLGEVEISNPNYRILEGGEQKTEVEKNWSILRAELSGITISDKTVDYTGHIHSVQVSSTTSHLGDNLVAQYSITPVEYAESDNGAIDVYYFNDEVSYYTIEAVIEHHNYETYYVPNTAEPARVNARLTINPVNITNLSMSNSSSSYNAEIQYLYVNQAAGPLQTLISTQIGDEVVIAYQIFTSNGQIELGVLNGAINTGSYEITATIGEDDGNYNLLEITRTLSITPASILNEYGLEITMDEELVVTYNLNEHSISVNATDGDPTQFASLDNAEIAITYTINGVAGNSAINAGNYDIVASIKAFVGGVVSSNYEEIVLTAWLLIEKAEMFSVAEDDIFYLVGDTFDYDSNRYYLNVNTVNAPLIESTRLNAVDIYPMNSNGYTSGYDSAEVSYLYTFNAMAASRLQYAGVYTVSAVISNNNYDSVSLGAVTITINTIDIESVYLNLPPMTGEGENQRHYDYTNSYYSIGVARNSVDIVTSIVSTITLTIDGYSTSDTATIAYFYDYFLPGDENALIEDQSFNNSIIKNAGNYVIRAYITATGNASDSYNMEELAATMIVAKAQISGISFENIDTVYDGIAKSLAVSSNVTQFGETVNIRYTAIADSGSAQDMSVEDNVGMSALNADLYFATAYINEDSEPGYNINYKTLISSAQLFIDKAQMYGLSFENDSAIYDGGEYFLALLTPDNIQSVLRQEPLSIIDINPSTNIAFIDVANVSYFINESVFEGAINAGEYEISVMVESENYYDFIDSSTLTVEKAQMWATVDGEEASVDFYFIEEQENTHTRIYDTNTWFFNVNTDSQTVVESYENAVFSLAIRPEGMSLIAGLNLADTAQITYVYDGNDFVGAKNFGEYELTALIQDSSENYYDIILNGTVIIEKVAFNGETGHLDEMFVAEQVSLVYDSLTHYIGVTNNYGEHIDEVVDEINLLSGDGVANIKYYYNTDDSGLYETQFNGATNAGEYYIYAYLEISSPSIAQNYDSWDAYALLEILKVDFIDDQGHLGQLFLVGTSRPYDTDSHYVGVNTVDEWLNNHITSLNYEEVALTLAVSYEYSYNSVSMGVFNGTNDVGVYEVTAQVAEGTNNEGWSATATITIEKLTFANIEGHLGELFINSDVIVYDKLTHYAAVNSDDTPTDANITSIFGCNGNLVIPVDYYYNTDGGEIYSDLFSGAADAGTYYIMAEILDTINYEGWQGYAQLEIEQLRFEDSQGHLGNIYLKEYTLVYDTNTYYLGINDINEWENSLPSVLNYTLEGGQLDIFVTYTYSYKLKPEDLASEMGEFNGARDAGIYIVTAEIEADLQGNYEGWEQTSELVIQKAVFGEGALNELFFNGNSFKYDMTTKYAYASFVDMYSDTPLISVDLLGTDGSAAIKYYYNTDASGIYEQEFNGAENSGTYYLYAYVDLNDNTNYEIWEEETVLSINSLNYHTGEIGDIRLNNGTTHYNALTHYTGVTDSSQWLDENIEEIVVNLAGGQLVIPITYKYTTTQGGDYNDIFEGAINAGVYYILAEIEEDTSGNYSYWQDSATLTINKLLWDGTPNNLDLLYFVGNQYSPIDFDGYIHYVGINTENQYNNNQVDTLYYLIDSDGVYSSDEQNANLVIPVVYTYYIGTPGSGNYTDNFEYALNAGIYNIRATIEEDISGNYEGWTNDAVFIINQLQWTDLSPLGSLYLTGANITYDTLEHYAGVSYFQDTWEDTPVNSLSYTIGDVTLNIDIEYTYFMGESGDYNTPFVSATDAGLYNIRAVINENTNYEGWTSQATLTINKLQWNGQEGNLNLLYFDDVTIDYDMQEHYIGVNIIDEWNDNLLTTLNYNIDQYGVIFTGEVSGNVSIAVSYTYKESLEEEYLNAFTGKINAGSVYIKATINESTNYEGYEAEAVLTINQLSFSIGSLGEIYYPSATILYDMQTHYLSINPNGNEWNDSPLNQLSYELTGGTLYIPIDYHYFMGESGDYTDVFTEAQNAGVYNVRATIQEHTNYTGDTFYATLTIEKLQFNDEEGHLGSLYFTPPSESLIYDSQRHYMAITYIDEWYDGEVDKLVYELEGGTLNIPITYMVSKNGGEYEIYEGVRNVGTYSITATIDEEQSGNYEGADFIETFVIEPFETTILWDKPYQNDEYVYNGQSQSGSLGASVQLTAYEGVETLQLYYYSDTDISGNYTLYDSNNYIKTNLQGVYVDNMLIDDLTLIGDVDFYYSDNYVVVAMFDDENYSLDNSHTLVQYLTMNKAQPNFNLIGYSIVYDGYTHYVSASSGQAPNDSPPTSIIQLLGDDEASISYYYNTDGTSVYTEVFEGVKNAGVYYIKAVIDDEAPLILQNYEAWIKYAELTIDKKTLTVSSTSAIDDWTKIYDSTANYTDYTLSGICSPDSLKLTHYAEYNNKNANTNKDITFVLVDSDPLDAVSDNYTISTITNGVILQKELRALAEIEWSKIYDGTVNVYPRLNETNIYNISSHLQVGYQIISGDTTSISAWYDNKNVDMVNKVIFSLIGSDSSNYFMDEHIEEDLITPLYRDVNWVNKELIYNGYERKGSNSSGQTYTYAYIELVGDDIDNVYLSDDGVLMFDIDFFNAINHSPSDYIDAGEYYGEINDERVDYDAINDIYSIEGNYVIESETLVQDLAIEKLEVTVDWQTIGPPIGGSIVYGQDNSLEARVAVVGKDDDGTGFVQLDIIPEGVDDNEYNGLTLLRDGVRVYEFKNAGSYTITAVLCIDIAHNYTLQDSSRSNVVIQRASINEYFRFENDLDGSDRNITYYEGIIRYFFVVDYSSGQNFGFSDGSEEYGSEVMKYYEYDTQIPVTVNYTGAMFEKHEVSQSFADGENGVKDVNVYQITAYVLQQENYYGWTGSIDVVIEKGDIKNIDIADRTVDNSEMPLIYNGGNYYIYCASKLPEESPGTYFNTYDASLTYPDARSANISYSLQELEVDGPLTLNIDNTVNGNLVMDGEDYVIKDGGINLASAGYDEVGYYLITASITGESNYNDWTQSALLRIVKYNASVNWQAYDGDNFTNINNINFEFLGIDQYDRLRSYIDTLGSDGISGRAIFDVTTQPCAEMTEYFLNNGKLNEFRLAGNYDLGVELAPEFINYDRIMRNYNITGDTISKEISKYEVSLKWYLNGYIEEYDVQNPPIYDGIEHSVYAQGLGIEYASGYNGELIYTTALVPIETDEYDEYGNRQWTALYPGDYNASALQINPDSIANITYYFGDGSSVMYGACKFAYNYTLPSTGTTLEWKIQKRLLSVELDDESVELWKYYDGSNRFDIDEEGSVFEFIDSGEVVFRNGVTIRLYNQIASYSVVGINGYNTFSYVIMGILETDTLVQYICEHCGWTYVESNINSYTIDDDSPEGYSTIVYEAGTRWSQVSEDFQCPGCKEQSARFANDLVEDLYNMVFFSTANLSVIDFVGLAEFTDKLIEACDNQQYNWQQIIAAYNSFISLDQSVKEILDYTLTDIEQLIATKFDDMVNNLRAECDYYDFAEVYTLIDIYENLDPNIQSLITTYSLLLQKQADVDLSYESASGYVYDNITIALEMINSIPPGAGLESIYHTLSTRYMYELLNQPNKDLLDNHYHKLLSAEIAIFGQIDNIIMDMSITYDVTHYDFYFNAVDIAYVDMLTGILDVVYDNWQIELGAYNLYISNKNEYFLIYNGMPAFANENTAVAARLAYDMLPDATKGLISSIGYLEKVEADIAIQRIEDTLDSLNIANQTQILDNIGKIYYAYNTYYDLSDDAKSLVLDYDTNMPQDILDFYNAANSFAQGLTPTDVIDRIQSAVYEGLYNYDDVLNERLIYENLSEPDKAQVANLSRLTGFEGALAEQIIVNFVDTISANITVESALEIATALRWYKRQSQAVKDIIYSALLSKLMDFQNIFSFDYESNTLSDEIRIQRALLTYGALPRSVRVLMTLEDNMKVINAMFVEQHIAFIGEVTLNKSSAIQYARQRYDSLSAEEKALVTTYDELVSAETALDILLSSLDYNEVISMIEDLPPVQTIGIEDIYTITNIRNLYENLSPGDKGYVTNLYLLEEVEGVIIDLVDAEIDKFKEVTEITYTHRNDIVRARTYFSFMSAYLRQSINEQDIIDAEQNLDAFIYNESIATKDDFQAIGVPIRLNPDIILIKDHYEEYVSNISATNADILWATFDSSNYALAAGSTGATGATNVMAQILPLPITIEFGAQDENKIYDGESHGDVFDENNPVSTAVDIYDGEELEQKGWQHIFSRVFKTKDEWGQDVEENLIALHQGNIFYGDFAIAGYDYMGRYVIGVYDASIDYGLHNFIVFRQGVGTEGEPYWFVMTLDEDGFSNYDITINIDERTTFYDEPVYVLQNEIEGVLVDSEYEIVQRDLQIEYSNLLQSWQAEQKQDIKAISINDGNGDIFSLEQFLTLMEQDGFIDLVGELIADENAIIKVFNNWAEYGFDTYMSYEGSSEPETPLYCVMTDGGVEEGRNANNYSFNMPVLQITYLLIEDSEEYWFYVYTIQDLQKLAADVEGLRQARENSSNPVGKIPTYNQQNHISGIENGGYEPITDLAEFDGIYDGNDYAISNVLVISSTIYGGLFASLQSAYEEDELVGGIIENVHLKNVKINANSSQYVGSIVGYADGGRLTNITVEGLINIDSALYGIHDINVGGIIGYAQQTFVDELTFVGYINIKAESSFTVGGLIGKYETPETVEEIMLNNLYSFANIYATTQYPAQSYLGALIGEVELLDGGIDVFIDLIGNDFSYLANSMALHGEEGFFQASSTAIDQNSIYEEDFAAMTYDEMLDSQDSYILNIIDLLFSQVVKDFYISANDYYKGDEQTPDKIDIGTQSAPVLISNFKQLELMRIYPWLNYQLINDVKVPLSLMDRVFEYAVAGFLTSSENPPAEYELYCNSYGAPPLNNILFYQVDGIAVAPVSIQIRQKD